MFTDPSDPIVSVLSDAGRTAFARSILGDISFILKGFAVGRGGYLSSNPVKIIPIVSSDVSLIDQIEPLTGQQAFEAVEQPTQATIVANCRLASDQALFGLGELGLFAEVVYSTIPSEIGDVFLFSISHYPLQTKTLRQAILYRIIIQF